MQQIRSLLLTILTLMVILGSAAHYSGPINFYYFFPDSVQANFSRLTSAIHTFFSRGKFENHFQAFTHQADFDQVVRTRPPGMLLVPNWYYQLYGKELELQPLLTALNRNRSSYNKVLLIRRDSGTGRAALTGKTIAVTNMGPDTGIQLDHYFSKKKLDFAQSNIIITPKDADAYYALVLGQVDAAVVGETTVKTVSNTNPRFQQVVREVAVSSPIPMPLLCVTKGVFDEQEIARIKAYFLESGSRKPLPPFMRMLHISGWKNDVL